MVFLHWTWLWFLRSFIYVPFIFCLLLFVFLDLNFIYLILFNFPTELFRFSFCQWLYYLSSFKMPDNRLIISFENEAKTIFLVGFGKLEHTIETGEFLFIMVILEHYLKNKWRNLNFLFLFFILLYLLDLLLLFFFLLNHLSILFFLLSLLYLLFFLLNLLDYLLFLYYLLLLCLTNRNS